MISGKKILIIGIPAILVLASAVALFTLLGKEDQPEQNNENAWNPNNEESPLEKWSREQREGTGEDPCATDPDSCSTWSESTGQHAIDYQNPEYHDIQVTDSGPTQNYYNLPFGTIRIWYNNIEADLWLEGQNITEQGKTDYADFLTIEAPGLGKYNFTANGHAFIIELYDDGVSSGASNDAQIINMDTSGFETTQVEITIEQSLVFANQGETNLTIEFYSGNTLLYTQEAVGGGGTAVFNNDTPGEYKAIIQNTQYEISITVKQ